MVEGPALTVRDPPAHRPVQCRAATSTTPKARIARNCLGLSDHDEHNALTNIGNGAYEQTGVDRDPLRQQIEGV